METLPSTQEDTQMQILKKKTLTYNIGITDDEYHLRISDNSGGGFFSTEWVALSDITALTPKEETFSTSLLLPLYESKSSNNQGFLAAVLVEEKLWLPVIGNRRLFSMGDVNAFTDSMQQLIKKSVNLKDEVAAREARKESARIALEKKIKAQRTKTSKAKTQPQTNTNFT
jgi:hypothetical protein